MSKRTRLLMWMAHLLKSKQLDVGLNLDVASSRANDLDNHAQISFLLVRVLGQPVNLVRFGWGRSLEGGGRVEDAEDEPFCIVEDQLVAIADEAAQQEGGQ